MTTMKTKMKRTPSVHDKDDDGGDGCDDNNAHLDLWPSPRKHQPQTCQSPMTNRDLHLSHIS